LRQRNPGTQAGLKLIINQEIDMNATATVFEPAGTLLAKLLSMIPGILVPGLVGLAACLCVLVFIDGYVDRAIIDRAQ
jgi:hypothetical protein